MNWRFNLAIFTGGSSAIDHVEADYINTHEVPGLIKFYKKDPDKKKGESDDLVAVWPSGITAITSIERLANSQTSEAQGIKIDHGIKDL